MKLIALSSGGPLGGYVVRRIHQALPLEAALRVTPAPRRRPWRTRLRSWLRGGFVYGLEHRLFYRRMYDRQEQVVAGMLADESAEIPPVAWRDVRADALNGEATVAMLRELEPDILLVCSAPLLKPAIFTIPKIATINVHFGLSPYYRGENTLFWPLYFRDYERLGVTVHRIDAGIDTGPIVGQATVACDPSDNELTLLAKATRLCAELSIETLQRLEEEPSAGTPQTQAGRQFNFRARRYWHDATLFLRQLAGRERLPSLPERRWFNGRPLHGDAAGVGDESEGADAEPWAERTEN